MRLDTSEGKRDARDRDVPDPDGAAILALKALAWTIGDARRADRLLSLTGMDAGTLRTGADDPAVLGALLSFLADHEPDLVACADAIDATPERLIAARDRLIA